MTAPVAAQPSRPAPNVDQTFPKLTPVQIDRVAAHGRVRHVDRGEELGVVGRVTAKFFVVTTASVEVVQPVGNRETTVTAINPGEFTGEVIEVERDELLALVQTDAELSEIFVRAFLLRRAGLIAGASASRQRSVKGR